MPLQLTITGDTPEQLAIEMFKALAAFKMVSFTPGSQPEAGDASPKAVTESGGASASSGPADASSPPKRRGRPRKNPPEAAISGAAAAVEEKQPAAEASPPTPAPVAGSAKAETSSPQGEAEAPPAVESSPSAPAAASEPELPDFLNRTAAPAAPTKDDATTWLKKVTGTRGMEAGIAVVKSIGETRMSTMPPEKYGLLIEACKKALAA